jgi:predicted permease
VIPAPEQLLDAVRGVPGVIAAGAGTHTPLDGSSWSEAIMPAGQLMPETDNALIVAVGPGFMDALQMPLVSGRAFTSGDRAESAPVAIVNERYAERFLQDQPALGTHLVSNLMGKTADLQVVGVVRNTAASNLRRLPPAIVYVPFAQFGANHGPSLVIRVSPSGARVAVAVQEALRRQLPANPVEIRALSTQIGGTILRERLMATLAGAFGVLALGLASIGLYGLLAYSVVQRFREIGIRMALGASSAGVVKSVLFGGARLVAIGVVAGCLVVWTVTRSIESMLFQLTPTDPSAILAAILILVGAASLASYLPARRASRVDPLRVLRDQ